MPQCRDSSIILNLTMCNDIVSLMFYVKPPIQYQKSAKRVLGVRY